MITVVKEIGEPRVPSLRGKMTAKKIEVPIYGLDDLGAHPESVGLAGSPTQVVEIFAPKPRGKRIRIEGRPEEQAEQLLDALRKDKILSGGSS